MLADDAVQQQEQVLDAGLGEDAGNQAHSRLRHRERLVDRRGRLVIQRIGVETLALLGDAGTHFALHVFVFEQREHLVADSGNDLPIDAAGLSRADNPALAAYEKVIQCLIGGKRLSDFHTRIIGEIGIVQQRPLERGLDLLDIHHQIGDRASEEPVGNDDRRHGRERHFVELYDVVLRRLA